MKTPNFITVWLSSSKLIFNSCLYQSDFGSGERAAVVGKKVAKLSLGKKGGVRGRRI